VVSIYSPRVKTELVRSRGECIVKCSLCSELKSVDKQEARCSVSRDKWSFIFRSVKTRAGWRRDLVNRSYRPEEVVSKKMKQ